MSDAFASTPEAGWTLENEGYDVRSENNVEARLAIGNGFLGVRAARSISRAPTWLSFLPGQTWTSWPRTYVAGLFDTPNTDPPVPALVPLADWLRVRVILDGEPLLLRTGQTMLHRRTLDMRRGVLIGNWQQRTPSGAVVQVRSLHLVSLADRAIGFQQVQLVIDGKPSDAVMEASFECAGLGMQTQHLEQNLGVWCTTQNRRSVAMAGDATLSASGRQLISAAPIPLTWRWNWTSTPGETVCLTRFVAVARGDAPDADPAAAVRDALTRATSVGWRAVLSAHEAAWAARWEDSDLAVDGDSAAATALRFAVYHLNSAANPHDERVSIGARALTGDSYLGHVFWDTEIYLLPFYILTWPEAARALLLYRFHTLRGAREKAAAGGWRGAMYAWESADTGEETTPDRVMTQGGKLVD
ncbi:MAG TPA: hypothetical protein VHX39_30070, partial [Acetobacteraceae bacterium]|nr:hypothetical protein [Acetobacteraceae bacterium]